MNRREIKNESKAKIKGNLWNLFTPILIYLAITLVLPEILQLCGLELTTEAVKYIGTTSYVVEVSTRLGQIVDLLLRIVGAVLSVGIINFTLKFVRKDKIDINNMFNCLSNKLGVILLTTILVYVFTLFGCIAFIIPGLIIATGCSMTSYIIVDSKKTNPMEIIKKSFAMMKGYKWDYFVFSLSFLGWYFVVGITFGLALIWVGPYVNTANALYYEKLKEISK